MYKELPQHAVERRQIAFYIALIKVYLHGSDLERVEQQLELLKQPLLSQSPLQETLESEPTPKLTILCGDIDEDMSRQSVPLNREYLSLQVQVGLRADNEEVKCDGGADVERCIANVSNRNLLVFPAVC